jgi:L-alanine-DL-glutamate epimerase-like enolase superfamily enzyme
MKIVQMSTTAVSLPMEHRSFFGKENPRMSPVIVQLLTDQGLEGFGLAYAINDFQVKSLKASIDDLAEIVIGLDISRWAANWKDLHTALKHTGQWGGYGVNAIAAIDTALWDIRAKACGLPLARLLGGFRDRVPAYASNWLWGFLSIDELQKDAVSLVEQGHRAMKMKMGGKDPSPEPGTVQGDSGGGRR